MKKVYIGLILLVMLVLTACEGDFKFDKAVVVTKSTGEYSCRYSTCQSFIVTVTYNGSNYNIVTDSVSYKLVNEGSIVEVNYDVNQGYAILTPVIE